MAAARADPSDDARSRARGSILLPRHLGLDQRKNFGVDSPGHAHLAAGPALREASDAIRASISNVSLVRKTASAVLSAVPSAARLLVIGDLVFMWKWGDGT